MCRRLRAVLPRLHVLPTLSERPGETVVALDADELISVFAERVAPDGDVLVVDKSVDVLERLRASTKAPNVFYLIGFPEVLPLTDASVDEVLATAPPTGEAAAEFFRVLRSGGRVAFAASDEDPGASALNLDAHEVERLFSETGFAAVTVASADGRLAVAAHKP